MKYKYYMIAVFLIINAASSYSQNNSIDTIQKKSFSLNEVVISANKIEETKRTVAQQMQSISAKETEMLQAQSTADLIANSGNVFVQKSQMGGGSPVIRGFEANRILLVVDGVRMNNIIYRAGHLQDIVKTDNNNLDRVEILFGPASTIYGSDALGGVIHLFTKKPLFSATDILNTKANAFFRYGSINNEKTGHVDFNIGGNKIASFTSFTFSSFGDLRGGENQNPFYKKSYGERPYYAERILGKDSLVENNDRFLQVQSGYSQYDLLQKITVKQNDNFTHGLNIQYSSSTDVPRYDRLTDPNGSGLKSSEWYYGPQKKMLVTYDMNLKKFTETFQGIHIGLNFQRIEESRHNRNFGSDYKNHRIEKVNVFGANFDFQKIIRVHKIRFGADMQLNGLKSTANKENIVDGTTEKLDTRYPDGINKMTNAAAYFSHTWQVNDKLVLTDGLRLGYSSLHSTLVDTSIQFSLPYTTIDQKTPVYSGSASLIHSPGDNLKLSFLISTGFRVPNADDISKIFESAPGAVIVPNADLKPEKTINYEAGITNIFYDKVRWENTAYYTDLYDAIVTDKFTFNGEDSILYDGTLSQVYANQNKGRSYICGLSSNIKWQCSEQTLLFLTANYTYGRIKTDSSDIPLDHIPPFFSRLQLSYTKHNFSSDFSVNYNGWKRIKDYNLGGEDNEQYATPEGMPAWFTINLHASYKIHKLVTLQAGIDNVFDTQYRTFASGINAPGRNVFAALRFAY